METTGIVETFVQGWLIGMILMVVPMTIHAIITDRRHGDSWKTILKRYF